MSKSQRDKGARWERELSLILSEVYPEAQRGLGQARSAAEVPDIDIPDFWVEAKCGARCNPLAALRQADLVRPDNRIPIAVCKQSWTGLNSTTAPPPTVTMYLGDWLELVAAWRLWRDTAEGAKERYPTRALTAKQLRDRAKARKVTTL